MFIFEVRLALGHERDGRERLAARQRWTRLILGERALGAAAGTVAVLVVVRRRPLHVDRHRRRDLLRLERLLRRLLRRLIRALRLGLLHLALLLHAPA